MAEKADSKVTLKLEAKSNKARKTKDGLSTPQSNSRPNSRAVSRDSTPKFNTPKSSREGTPRSNTPKSSRGNTPKPCTPKPMPKYQYSKVELLKFRRSPLSIKIPLCLEKYKDILPDIILNEPLKNLDVQVRDSQTGDVTVISIEDDIDADHWYKHIHIPRDDSRGNSPLTLSGLRPMERKPRHAEADTLFKRKDTSRDDEDGGGIVLGPQRKSFDTGCHVSTLGKQDPARVDRNSRRIGSGRIAMRHDNIEEDRASRKELPQLEQLRQQAGRGRRGGFTDRSYSNRREYDYRDDERDFGERRYDRRRDYRRHEAEEPEWFSAGPTSQLDTIELRGFEEPQREPRRAEARHDDEEEYYEENEGEPEEAQRGDNTEGAVLMTDRNGSLETNESSSPETSPEDREHAKANTSAAEIVGEKQAVAPGAASQFDFNDLFNIDNIPGLSNLVGAEAEVLGPQLGAGGSRFSQWFQGSNTPVGSRGPASRSNSRRSSITDEFSYLHDLINGSKSPAVASPEPADPALGRRGSPIDRRGLIMGASPVDKRYGAHPAIMQLLNGQQRVNQVYHAQQQLADMHAQPKLMPQGALNVSDVEASIKSLILAGAKRTTPGSAPQPNIPHPVVPSGGHVLTAEELEATLTGRTNTDLNPRSQESRLNLSSDRDTQKPYTLTSHKNSAVLSAQSQSLGQSVSERPFVWQSHQADESRNQSTYKQFQWDSDHAHRANSSAIPAVNSNSTSQPSSVNSSSQHSSFSSDLSAPSTAWLGSHGNRMQTVAELEAGLKERAVAAAMEQLAGSRQATEPTTNDMAAFNRLLCMVNASQNTQASRPQQVGTRDSHRSVTPTLQHHDTHDQTVLRKLLQHQQAQQNLQAQASKQLQMKHLQQQQQQQTMLNLMNQAPPTQHPAMVPGHPAAMLPAQPGAAIVPGQAAPMVAGHAVGMVRGQAVGMMKSPIPPPLNLHAPGAVAIRAPSPLLPPNSPRAPSPIMFGSQPPMHLTAPSPIHAASQLPRSPSPNTLQVTPNTTRRVLSPQELHTHAQAIMQNALIKKQLEGQKQRFLQKQQQTTSKSPSPGVEISMAETNILDVKPPGTAVTMTSAPATTLAGLNPAFTPTSVIRKMANDKMEGKEKQADEHNINADKAAAEVTCSDDTSTENSRRSSAPSDASGNISIAVPHATPTADSQAQSELSRLQAQFHVTMEHLHSGKPVPAQHVANQQAQATSQKLAPRPLVGQGAMNNAIAHPSQSFFSNQTQPQGVAMQQQAHPTSVAMQQLSHQPPHQAVATQQRSLSNHTPPSPQQLAQMQHQHMLATSQAMALQHGGHMVGAMSQALSNNTGIQSATTSHHGRPIVKGVQPSGINTISPPSSRHPVHDTQRTAASAQSQQPLPMHLPGQPIQVTATQQSQRPIVGTSSIGAKGTNQLAHDSVRMAEQARMAQIQAQLQAGAHLAKASPYAVNVQGGRVPVPMGGMLPVQLTQQQHQQAAVANALLMQRMMMNSQTAQGLHPQQLAALQAAQLSQHQQQQRHLDNRATQARAAPVYPPSSVHYTQSARGIHGQGAAAQQAHAVVGRSVSPHQQAQMLANMHAKQENAMGRGLAQGGDGLAKFFGTDLLKQQLGMMPPLPNQGQSIMTVEEIERKQQMITNERSVPQY